jgi:hypothetical protein
MNTNPLRIITEEMTAALEPRFKALADFIDLHGGEDLVRHLHAQDVEIVTHSTGALLKCYRTKSKDTQQPEDCWRFWSGHYEVDANHLDDFDGTTFGAGFTQNDLRRPIDYILSRTKDGSLDLVEPGTLIVVQVGTGSPEVRTHALEPEGNMVVVGVKYDISDDDIGELLSNPGDIEEQALKWSGRWESHLQLQKIADLMGTDSTPLLFRGRLAGTGTVVDGMRKSAEDDPTFRQILNGFLAQAGENPTDKDYERFFRRAIRRFDDFEIRKLDKKGKVSDSTLVTKNTYKDVIEKLYRRFTEVEKEIGSTIDQYGKDSKEHEEDYRDLNYLAAWLREQVTEYLFGGGEDPITLAIHSLEEVKQRADEPSVLMWVRRHLEEMGVPSDLYGAHLKDPSVPLDRHMGRNALWEMFMREANKFISSHLTDVVADAT